MPQSMLSFLLKMTKQFLGAIAAMNNALADLGPEQHADKTTISPAAHSFGFLGHTYGAANLGLAERSFSIPEINSRTNKSEKI